MKVFLSIYMMVVSVLALSLFQDKERTESIERGAKLYKSKCAACHKKDGTGRGKNFPPLANSDFLLTNREESIRAVKYGLEKEITVNGTIYNKGMKAVELSDTEIADVLNFALNSWGNTSDTLVTKEAVSALKAE